jgi:hypothetical protein
MWLRFQAIDAGQTGLHNAKKFNSTSTLFVDSTVSQPNMDETLHWYGTLRSAD